MSEATESVLSAMMGGAGGAQQIVCNSCQCTVDDAARQDHYRSEWHRYNIKRRVHNLPPISNAVFQQKLAALNEQKVSEEKEKAGAKCDLCGNVFQSQKAYANHLASKKHLKKLEKKAGASQAVSQAATPATKPADSTAAAAAIPPAALTPAAASTQTLAATTSSASSAPAAAAAVASSSSSAAASGGAARKTGKGKAAGSDSKGEPADDDESELPGYNPADSLPLGTCLFCSKFFAEKPAKPAKPAAAKDAKDAKDVAAKDATEKTAPAPKAAAAAAADATEPKGDVEAALEHMAKAHGFFIPYVEYCTDVNGLLGYLGAKVGMGRVCLYCDGRGRQRYPTVQAVEQHMVAKGHCKIRFEENDVDEEVLDFYEFPDRDGADDEDDDDDDDAAGAADRKSATATAAAGALIAVDDGKGKQLAAVGGAAPAAAAKRSVAEVNEHGELVLTDGSVIGHRNLKRYYSQNAKPRETRESVLINQLVSKYKLLALPGYNAAGKITPQMKQAQKAARKRSGAQNEKIGTNSNLLIRKYFRVATSL